MKATLVNERSIILRKLIERNDLVLEPLTDLELVSDFWDVDVSTMLYNLEMASLDDYNINEWTNYNDITSFILFV